MKIYVGNLAQETTAPQLRESFEKFGPVTSLNIVMDKLTGKPRGFAFVEMSTDEHAQKAITELHGTALAGSLMRVNAAKSN